MFFCIQKLRWFCWKSSSPLRPEKKKKSDTHPPTNPTNRSQLSPPYDQTHRLRGLVGLADKKTPLQNQRHFICRSVSYLKSTKSCLVFFVGPQNSRDVQTNMILSLLHLLGSITQILRPTYSIIHKEYIVWKINEENYPDSHQLCVSLLKRLNVFRSTLTAWSWSWSWNGSSSASNGLLPQRTLGHILIKETCNKASNITRGF